MTAGARAKNLLASLALAVASWLVLVGALEVGVRLFVPETRWRFEDGTGDWRLDDEIGWVHKPDLDVTTRTLLGPVRFRTNGDGLIPGHATRAKPAGTLRIMIFGDSMLVGRWIAQDQVYSARLEAILRARGIAADVVNAGVQGYSTDQALLLMQRWVPAYRPDLVLYGSTLNDLGGNAVDHAYGQAKPVFRLDEQARLRLSAPRLAPEIRGLGHGPRAWIQRSALYRLFQPAIFLWRARGASVEERLLLGDLQEIYVRPKAVESLDWTLFAALLARMRQTAEREGARFLCFEHPEVAEVWRPYIEKVQARLGVPAGSYDPLVVERRLAAVAAEQRVDFVPLVPVFRAAQARGPFHLLPHDPHLNRAGHDLLAEVLADVLEPRIPRAPVNPAPPPPSRAGHRAPR